METIYNYDWADKNAKLQVRVCDHVRACASLPASHHLCTLPFLQLVPTAGEFLPTDSKRVWGKVRQIYYVKKRKPGDEVGINMLKKHRSVRIDYLKETR